MLTALSFLAGAKRWFNADTLKALSIAIAAVVCLAAFVLLFKAGGAAKEASVNWKWLQQISELNRKRAERVAAIERNIAQATAIERDAALVQLQMEADRAADLERQLAALKDNPVAFPKSLARSLNQ